MSRTVQGIAVTGGASTATNVTYNNDSSGLNAENSQDAIDELQSSKINKTSILQESGNAEDKVMSQKATTNAIADETTRAKAAEKAIIYDVSACNSGVVFESLSALLSSSNLSTLIPTSVRHGGMSIRFIQDSVPSSDNKYVQFRLIANTFTTDVTKWQGVENKPSAHSKNLVESGGLYDILYGHYKAVKAPDSVGATYIDFNIDGTIIQYSKETIFQIVPNKTCIVQFRSSDSAIGQKQVTSDSNGIIPLVVTNNTNATIVRFNGIVSGNVVVFENGIEGDINELQQQSEDFSTFIEEIKPIVEDNNAKINGPVPMTTKNSGSNNYVDFVIDTEIKLGTTIYFKINNSDGTPFSGKIVVQLRNSSGAIAQADIVITNGIGSKYYGENSRATYVRCVNVGNNRNVSVCYLEDSLVYKTNRNSIQSAKLVHYKEIYDGIGNFTINEGDIFENCVFKNMTIAFKSHTIFKNCDFVNTILVAPKSRYTSYVRILNCNFIGDNARIQGSFMYDAIIDGNNFAISDDRYPNATPKTKGEYSRNIFAYGISRCRITNNLFEIGRTGICILGTDKYINDASIPEQSSIDNIIANNYVAGIGEEHISFDGAPFFDRGTLNGVSIAYRNINTGQGQDADQNLDQTKWVVDVTLSITSDILGVKPYANGKHIKNYASIPNGFYGVNINNSRYYKVVSGITLVGETDVDDEDNMEYSINGTYQVTIEVPTIYNFKRNLTDQAKAKIEAQIANEWTIGDKVAISAIQSRNVIVNNVIEGIGTDAIGDVDDMGGIVLYGVCFHNIVSNNFLRQKRIWLMEWDFLGGSYSSKLKIQSFNTIANNVLQDTSISMDRIQGNGFRNTRINRGNILSANIVSGTQEVAGIKVDAEEGVTMVANIAQYYRIRYCNNLKLIGNSVDDSAAQTAYGYYLNNTNVKHDATDDIFPQ